MCYHTSIPSRNELEREFAYARIVDEWEQFYYHLSGFDHAATPVITCESPAKVQLFYWGLIPYWVKTEKQAGEIRAFTLNATCENIFEKASFKFPAQKKRCLVLVNGFYEWRNYRNKKYPYYIFLKERNPFALAGLYDTWVNKNTGEVINSYSIITCPANTLMEQIHNKKKRMPVILSRDVQRKWLDKGLSGEQVKQLMIPYNSELMSFHPVSKLITSKTESTNVREVQEACVYAELPGLLLY